MLNRILSGWTITRVLYVAMGTFVIVESIMDKQWLGMALGGYFAAMGLFAFGCAAGNCYSPTNQTSKLDASAGTADIEFEEIKIK